MITIIITSYGEVASTERVIRSILHQKLADPFRIVVCDPFTETKWMIDEKFSKDPVFYEEDAGLGKSHALNWLLKKYSTGNLQDIFVLTDGDVILSDRAIPNLLEPFTNVSIGCVCGHPIPLNPKKGMVNLWAHISLNEMNDTRKMLAARKAFFEVSGYLFALRDGLLKSFPTGASEDNIIPALIWKRGFKIAYAEEAGVHVLCPQKLSEWLVQKKRNLKGHLALSHVLPYLPKRKNTMLQEAKRGIEYLFWRTQNLTEFLALIGMAVARLTVWVMAHVDVIILNKVYHDGWREEERLETTRLD